MVYWKSGLLSAWFWSARKALWLRHEARKSFHALLEQGFNRKVSMDRYIIHGGTRLQGEVEISGAKNAAVAIIPAALLVQGPCRIENIPRISDTDTLLTILAELGAKVSYLGKSTIEIDCTDARYQDAPFDLMRKIRASYYLIGSMLGRFGAAKTTMPGGCNFGVRPIDQHIKGMRALGAEIDVRGEDLPRQGLGRSDDEYHDRGGPR